MKRTDLLAGVVAGLLCSGLPASAQDATATAEREDQQANYKRVNRKLEDIEESLQLQAKRMAALASELSSLRDEVDRLKSRNDSAATHESIKHLAEKIEEVDRKRIADGETAKKTIAALGRDLSKSLTPRDPPRDPPSNPAPKQPKSTESTAPVEKGFTYKIQDGDTLVRIVNDLRAQDYKVTQKQIMDANPSINWNKLRIGQTVIIPPKSP